MPMTHAINHTRELVTLTGQDVLTDDELVACVSRMLADPDVTLSMPSLVDLRAVHQLDVTKKGLDALLSVVRTDGSPVSTARIAIVTDQTRVFMTRLLTALADVDGSRRQYRGFTDIGDAQSWLLGD